MSTRMKLKQKVDHFTVFKSFHSTSCCSRDTYPDNIIAFKIFVLNHATYAAHRSSRQITYNKIGWLDVRDNIRDVFIGWEAGDGLAGKGYTSKL